MKSTENLINELTQSHKPVNKDFSPHIRTFLVLYLCPSMVISVFYFMRPFTFDIKNPFHGLEILTIFIFLHLLTLWGFKSFIPGESKKTSSLLVLIFGFIMTSVFLLRIFNPQTFNEIRPYCDVEALIVSGVTTAIGHKILRRNEFALKKISSKIIFLSLPLMATFYLHGVCSLEWGHMLICHILVPLILPVLYLGWFSFYRKNL